MMQKVYLVVMGCAVLGAIAQILLKQGTRAGSLASYLNGYVFAGLLLYGLSMVIYLWVLPKGEVSILYPLIATSYIWVALLSLIVLKEHFTLAKGLGSLAIVFGVWVIVH